MLWFWVDPPNLALAYTDNFYNTFSYSGMCNHSGTLYEQTEE